VPKQYFQGKPIGYNITYYPVDLDSEIRFANVNYTTNTTTLTELNVYTKYAINVSAVSSGGLGPANMTMARTSSEGKGVLNILLNLRFNANDQLKCGLKESSTRVWLQMAYD